MKKILIIFLALGSSFSLFKNSLAIDITPNAKSSILIEVESGKVLYESNPYLHLAPASMTKIMTMMIILDEIKEGNLKWNDIVIASKEASSMGGSQVYLKENEKMIVTDMFKAIAIASANDCAYAMAEKISGTKDLFVKRMNDYISKLNLSNTNFVNPTGLSDDNHYSCSYDMAFIARNLLLNHEDDITRFTSTYQDYIRQESDSPFWLVNTNKVLKMDSDVDGLKTGWTEEAGYCITLTKKANGMRLIAVVMGYSSSEERNKECYNLLNYGFNSFKLYPVFEQMLVKEVDDIRYYPSKFNIITDEGLSIINNTNINKEDILYEYNYSLNDLSNIGYLNVKYMGHDYKKIKLKTDCQVRKASFYEIVIGIVKKIIG